VLEGWMPETVRRLCKVLNARGGAVLNQATVVKLLHNGTRYHGVEMEDGSIITCKEGVIVSGAHALVKLAGKGKFPEVEKAIAALGISAQHGAVFLTFKDKKPSDLDLPANYANLWIDEKYFFSHKYDKANNTTVVYLLSECKYFERGPDYLENKENYADELMKAALKHLPKLANYDGYDAATPATTEKWLMSDRGCSYGLGQPAARFGDYNTVRALRVEQAPGLWLTGQDVLFMGVCGALTNGFLAAQKILTPNLITGVLLGSGPNIAKEVITAWVNYQKAQTKEEEGQKSQ
jgi:hypothetical protein